MKKTGEYNKNLARFNDALLKIACTPIVDSGDLEASLKYVTESAARCTDAERVSIWFFNEDKSKIVCSELYELSKDVHSKGETLKASDFPSYFKYLTTERVLSADDAVKDPNTSELNEKYLHPLNVFSMLDVPIRLSGEFVGIICIENVGAVRHWTLHEKYFAGVLTEIVARAMSASEKKAAKDKIKQINAELEAANKAKDELLMIVSHELRTPLNVISGWTQLLRNAGDDPLLIQAGIEAITKNVKSQARIIDDLLDSSRIILGRLELEKKVFDVIPFLEETASYARVLAKEKNIRLVFESKAETAFVSGDAPRIQQALTNLLTNAVKYSSAGSEVRVLLDNLDSKFLEISVTDQGQGIEPSRLPEIFERFSLGDASIARNSSGLGLGLSIARYIVEAHGGKITAESAGKGAGSTFRFRLPLVDPPGAFADASKLSSSMGPKPLDGMQLLIVDDDPDSLALNELALKRLGAEVAKADNAADALKILQSFSADIMLCDLAMPGEDGFALIKKLRASSLDKFRNIPVIAVSAFTDSANRTKALESGFNGFIGKPVQFVSLVSEILKRRM